MRTKMMLAVGLLIAVAALSACQPPTSGTVKVGYNGSQGAYIKAGAVCDKSSDIWVHAEVTPYSGGPAAIGYPYQVCRAGSTSPLVKIVGYAEPFAAVALYYDRPATPAYCSFMTPNGSHTPL